MTDNYIVEDLKARLDCRQVVEADLGIPETTSTNGPWTFSCPFHIEQTVGGFRVFRDGYKCFSCGAAGDIFTWYMEFHQLSFMEAVARLNGGKMPDIDPEERVKRATERAEREEKALQERIEEAKKVLEELRDAQAWLRYHEQLTDQSRQLWHSWGVPEYWQGYWKLGYDPDHIIWTGTEEWHTPTMTIPIFENSTWEVLNIKHRLLQPFREGDKYRPESRGLPQAAWVSDPDLDLSGRTLIVEGEKKAMVSYITADDSELRVMGIPGKNPSNELIEKLDECEPIYICLDPDANKEAEKLANDLGRERTRIIHLPMKVDDAILAGAIDKNGIRRLMRMAG
jgi:DNA primase